MPIASFKAGEAVTAGSAVYITPVGLAYKASATNVAQAAAVGVAVDAGSIGELIRVNVDGVSANYSGFTPGEYQYISVLTSGQLVNYDAWASGLALTVYPTVFLTRVGRAFSPTPLGVELSRPTLVVNPTSVFLLESSTGPLLDAILQEDGSTIELEVV